MKHRETRYTPKKRKNGLLRILSFTVAAAVALMWFTREALGISVSTMFIYTGLALALISLSLINGAQRKKLEISDKHLDKMREEIGKDTYIDNKRYYE